MGVGPEQTEPLDRKGHLRGKSKEGEPHGGPPGEQTPKSQREETCGKTLISKRLWKPRHEVPI